MLKRFLDITMIVLVLITGWLIYECRNLEFDYDFESFFPVKSDDAEFYYSFRQQFEADNEFMLVGVKDDGPALNLNTVKKVDRLCNELKKVKYVKSVSSISTASTPVINSFGLTSIPAINLSNPENFSSDSARVVTSAIYKGRFISNDLKSLAIFIRHEERLKKEAADTLIEQIESLCTAQHFKETHISGKLKSESVYLYKTRWELLVFMSCSALLVTLFLWLTFRNAWGVLVPLTVVIASIIWTLGIMAATGKSIDIMVILMPCILFVVGMSDVIHITSQFYEKIDEGLSAAGAIRSSLQEVGFATFLTCISTAVAFLTLNTTSIQPIRDFGTYTAVGVVVAYILSITILPWILLKVKNPDRFKIHTVNVRWDRFLRKLLLRVYRNPKRILAGTVVLMLLSVWGISRIEVNNSVLDDLDKNDPVKLDFKFFDENFSGVRSFEMQVNAKDPSKDLLDWEILKELDATSNYLVNTFKVGSMISPLELVKGFNQATHDGEASFYKLPDSKEDFEILRQKLKPYLKNKEIRLIISSDLKVSRFSGRIRDKGSRSVGKKNDLLLAWLKIHQSPALQYRITGSADLVDKSNTYLTRNMLEGLGLDVAVLVLIIGLLFRSWRMMLLSVLPNVIPLVMIGGLMGWAGIEMKVTISIIFSIAFGIAVDDTLHLLSRLKVELDKGNNLPFALRTTFLGTGKAMILTAMVIAAGFSTLMLSDFSGTFYVGLLISLTLVIALIAELILMPVLILWVYGKKYHKKLAANKLKSNE